MTAPVTIPPTGGDEAPCSACVANKGLCHSHLREELPRLAEFPWRKWIGEPYVCSEPRCEEHVLCLDTRSASPRGGCGCHNCSQKRWARARAAEADEPSVAGMKAQRRNERKSKKVAERPVSTPAQRCISAMNGAFSRSRPARSAA